MFGSLQRVRAAFQPVADDCVSGIGVGSVFDTIR